MSGKGKEKVTWAEVREAVRALNETITEVELQLAKEKLGADGSNPLEVLEALFGSKAKK